jgi:hypothetical protein
MKALLDGLMKNWMSRTMMIFIRKISAKSLIMVG